MEAGHAAHADRPQRIAVIGLAQGHVTGLLRLGVRPLPPILKGHLQRDFHGRGPVVAEEDVPQARRGQIDQPLGQQDGRGVRGAEVRDVGHAVELGADGRVDARMPMTVDIAPQAADRVEIAAAVDIEDVAAFAALQNERLILGHLREGMPDQRAVPDGGVDRVKADMHVYSHATTTGVPTETPSRAAAVVADDRQFQAAGGPDQGHEHSRGLLAIGVIDAECFIDSADDAGAAVGRLAGQEVVGDVRDQVAERIDRDDLAADLLFDHLGQRQVELIEMSRGRAEPPRFEAQTQAGGDRGHDVAPMERVRNVCQPVFPLAQPQDQRWPRAGHQAAQQPVVRRDVLLRADAGVEDRSLAAHARIDHGHVDRVGRKPGRGVFQHQGPAGDILGRHRVRDIDDHRRRVDREDHALHRSHIGAAGAEIGGEGDDRHVV